MLTMDANVWVAAFDPTDALHSPSVNLLPHLAGRGEPICAPAFLVPEVGCALTRRLARPEAGAAAAARLQENPGLDLKPLDGVLLSRTLWAGTARGLRPADTLYVAVAEMADSILISKAHL